MAATTGMHSEAVAPGFCDLLGARQAASRSAGIVDDTVMERSGTATLGSVFGFIQITRAKNEAAILRRGRTEE